MPSRSALTAVLVVVAALVPHAARAQTTTQASWVAQYKDKAYLKGQLGNSEACNKVYNQVVDKWPKLSETGLPNYKETDGCKPCPHRHEPPRKGSQCPMPTAWQQFYDYPDELCCGAYSYCCAPDGDGLPVWVIVVLVAVVVLSVGGGVLGCYCCKCCCFSYRKNRGMPPPAVVGLPQGAQMVQTVQPKV